MHKKFFQINLKKFLAFISLCLIIISGFIHIGNFGFVSGLNFSANLNSLGKSLSGSIDVYAEPTCPSGLLIIALL